ncbi:MAG: hypothetical protein ACRDNP_16430 [Gaiellaceae bacterium]
MLKGLLLAIAVALLAAACMGDDGGGGDGGSVSASEGESLVLQPEDVGSEFTQFDRGEQRRADLSPPRDDPNRLDREGGWKARFSRNGSPETPGALVVSSLADLFGSADNAGEDFELYKTSLDPFVAAGGREVSVSGLGDEAYAVTFEQGRAPNIIHHYAIAWRDRAVTASVNANGFRLTWSQALALARAQEERIRSAAE